MLQELPQHLEIAQDVGRRDVEDLLRHLTAISRLRLGILTEQGEGS